MAKNMTPYEAGHLAGTSADAPMDEFEMSMRHDEFIVGFIVGYSEMESFRAASPRVAALTAGDLGYRYNVSANTLLQHLGFDAEQRAELRQAYADAAENAADDEEDEED